LAPPALYVEYRVRGLNGGAKSEERGGGREKKRERERGEDKTGKTTSGRPRLRWLR
jgi:hypothetical protein